MRLAVHGITILSSAFLLFAVQPMVGKALLPRLGGVPGAWTACLLFFQAALLVGYGYVWLGARFSARVRVSAHVGLLLTAGFAVAPFAALDGPSWLHPSDAPVVYALFFLASNVGLAFVLLSATAPLLSSWYAESGGGRPYSLYAASNAGSLGALLVYPFVVEPLLDLEAQAVAFRIGFGAVVVGIVAAGIGVVAPRAKASPFDANAEGSAPTPDEALGWRRRLTWVGLAFVPTTLLAGSSEHLSTDLAPLPLLWIVPLAIYLLSFILAFSERIDAPPPWLGRGACLVAVVLVFATITHANKPVLLLSLLHLLFLGAGSWIAHRRLAEDAPHPTRLPQFFVWIALGGVLGTLVSGVIAPRVLPDLWEYPAAIALACMTRAKEGVVVDDRPWQKDVVHVLVVAGLVVSTAFIVPFFGLADPQIVAVVSFGPAAVYSYRWMPLRRRYTLCLLALVLAGGMTQERGDRRLTTRSFFGVLRVVDAGEERHLLHGTTLHGTQRLDQRDACVPLAYYTEEGPLGSVFRAHRAAGRGGRTIGIGLGTGALTCYAAPGEPWRIIEINPDVISLATNPRWFTFLRNSPTDSIELSVGDGRIRLEDEDDGSLAMIIVDAFNSDSVPVHLLTREALALYLGKLEPGGWAVLHLSNRALDLPEVVRNIVAAEGAVARLSNHEHATYAVVAHAESDLEGLDPPAWRRLEGGDASAAWTDAFSSILPVIRLGM